MSDTGNNILGKIPKAVKVKFNPIDEIKTFSEPERGGGLEESKRSSSSSDAGGASYDAIRSAGAGTATGQQADAAHSSMRQHGHLYEEGLKLDLSQILTAASTVQAEALRASDDRRCCTTILLWITAIILYVAYWFLSED